MTDPAAVGRSSERAFAPAERETYDPTELSYWCKELHCSEAELKDAVSKVGEHVTEVREQLASRR
ncbi:MAG: DUF3606 domain-containing protein [Actinomycetota bacterium]|nr:DUF3606 domain-containing protein [Actinomycetota bacterium]